MAERPQGTTSANCREVSVGEPRLGVLEVAAVGLGGSPVAGPAARVGSGWSREGAEGPGWARGCPGGSSGSASEEAAGSPGPRAGISPGALARSRCAVAAPASSPGLVSEVPGAEVPRVPCSSAAQRQSPAGGAAVPARWYLLPLDWGRDGRWQGTAVTQPPPTQGCSSYLGRVSQRHPRSGVGGTLPLC